MYGDPSVLVLDEPNSNLDDVGEAALLRAINDLRERGKTIVLITHRTSVIGATNKLLMLREGQVAMFGPTNQVLQALQEQNQKQLEQRSAQPASSAGCPTSRAAGRAAGRRAASCAAAAAKTEQE
jgi:ATP-binding cassette subfamily C exporter for protease/lipase